MVVFLQTLYRYLQKKNVGYQSYVLSNQVDLICYRNSHLQRRKPREKNTPGAGQVKITPNLRSGRERVKGDFSPVDHVDAASDL